MTALTDHDVDRIAHRLVEILDERRGRAAGGGLVRAKVVAEAIDMDVKWVYAHADELGAIRFGDGPKPRLRFDLDEAIARHQLHRTAPLQRSRPAPRPGQPAVRPRRGRRPHTPTTRAA